MAEEVGTYATSALSLLSTEEVERFWNLITVDARPIVAELATKPKGYAFAKLQQVFSMDGLQVAGRLSSVGHVMRRFPGRAVPIHRDYRDRIYTMDPLIAERIRKLAGR